MSRLRIIIGILIGISFSLPVMADETRPLACKNFSEIKNQIHAIAPDFELTSPGCQIVATKSIFPKKEINGETQFAKGFQMFVYQDKQLKFICLPGWVCKPW